MRQDKKVTFCDWLLLKKESIIGKAIIRTYAPVKTGLARSIVRGTYRKT
jgi:hypothetical protein